jgi:hypothetical protein
VNEQVVLGVLVVWAIVATGAILVLLRQVALVSIRLDMQMRLPDLTDFGNGPEMGMMFPSILDDQPASFLLVAMSSACTSCDEFVRSWEAGDVGPPNDPLIVLLSGNRATARAFGERLPNWMRVVYDPKASRVGRDIGLSKTLLALHIVDGRVVGRADTRTAEEFVRLVHAYDPETSLKRSARP